MDKTTYKMKHPLLTTFFTAFIMFLISCLPILIMSGGVYLYSGDYNVQTIPFIEHAARYVHSKEPLPAYDWQASIGMNFLTAFGGYSTSPFSMLLYLFPVSMIKYAHGFVVALKVGISAAGAYVYCRQYVKKDRSAFICGILYAFSGFQLFNLPYPFMDSIAVFPLTLYAFDQLMEKRRSFWFAFMLFINGLISFYFLWQECVFILIYFLVRVIMKTYPKFDLKLFFKLGFETLIGVGMGGFMMIPAIKALSGNSRAGKLIFESNLMAYDSPGVVLKIIESMFFPPDFCGNGWYFTERKLSLDPPNLYIPLFLVVGVIFVVKNNKKKWYSILLGVCALFAAVPLLNSVFSMFNNNYYARWMYMPVLIMVMITGIFIDDIETAKVDKEITLSAAIICFLILWGVYSVYFYIPHDRIVQYTWSASMAYALLSVVVLYILFHPIEKLRFISFKNLAPITCILCGAIFFVNTFSVAEENFFEWLQNERNRMWNDDQAIEFDEDEEQFYRVSTGAALNMGLSLGLNGVDLFNSMCTGEETDFYSRVGMQRLQNTVLADSDYPVYSFLSTKYHLIYNETAIGGDANPIESITCKMRGFEGLQAHNWYASFKNSAFIPMGFTYDYYLNVYDFKPELGETKPADEDVDLDTVAKEMIAQLTTEETAIPEDEMTDEEYFEETGKKKYKYTKMADNEKLLLKAIWLTDAQIKKYGDILEELPEELAEDVSYKTYLKDCQERAAHACYEFKPDGKGFSAKIDLEKDNLVFFSIPYDEGFTAYVDGNEVEIEKVFDGLSAVFVPKGDHSIRFDYRIIGLREGGIMSIVCTVLLLIYTMCCIVIFVTKKKQGTPETAAETSPAADEITAGDEPAAETEENSGDLPDQTKE